MAYDGGFGDSKNASVDASDSRGGNRGDNGGADARARNPRGGRPFSDTRASTPSPADRGNGSNNPNRSLGSMRAELDRRDRAAVAALGPNGRNVNVASDVFNDDEEGINSISEALGRFGSWVQDRFGAGAPGGFAKSDVAGGLATMGGFLAGGLPGAAVAGAAHDIYSSPPGNTVGLVASVGSRLGGLGGLPGAAIGLASTGVGLVDQYVTDLDNLPEGSPMTVAARSLGRQGLTNFPGGSGGNGAVPPTSLASARTGNPATPAATTPKPNPNTIRRTFGPLNLRYAQLRGIDELL